MENVVVLGASNKPERYSHKAILLLKEYGYNIIPVHPELSEIEGIQVVKSLDSITDKVDTLTIYVSPSRIERLIDQIVNLKPARVILNPGTESKELESALESNGISFLKACTLILLKTNQF